MIVTCSGCAGGPRSVSLSHTGGISGIEQRYSIERDGHIYERAKLSLDTLRITRSGVAEPRMTAEVFDVIERHQAELDTLKLQGSGNLTTTLAIEGKRVHSLQWPNLDPPHISTTVVDSLYHMMLQIQETIGKLPAINQ